MSKQIEMPGTTGVRASLCCEMCGRPAQVGKNAYHLREVKVDGVIKLACVPCAKARKK